MFLPGGTPAQMQSFNELQKISTSAETAVRMRRAMDEIDVTDLLPRVRAPTLVIHCRGDAVAPFEEGRRVAAGIQGACFVALDSDNHWPLQTEPVIWSRLFEEINQFLRPANPALQLVQKR